MSSIKRLGLLYGRLGLATDSELIERRGKGVAAVSEAIERADIIPLARRAFGLGKPESSAGFLATMQDEDPTFDVQPDDVEAGLLASAILDRAIEVEGNQSEIAASVVVTAAVGGLRRPENHNGLLPEAEKMLARFQGSSSGAPAQRTYSAQPKTLTEAIQAIPANSNNYFSHASPSVVKALEELGKYSEANALAAARNDNGVLAYVRRLESELRLYWWVTGGWSADKAAPFGRMGAVEAAIRGGKELADKAFDDVGLFAAPAMLDMILERGRKHDDLGPVAIGEIARTGDLVWRRDTFSATGAGPLADILAVSTALHLSADSEDADDWHPRFLRMTGVNTAAWLEPVSLGLQIYRERLVSKAFA